MSNIKAVLLDIDGTLLRTDLTISAQVMEKIRQARRRGLVVGLCTGRSPTSITKVFDLLGWQGLHVVSGGGAIFDARKKINVFEFLISHNDAEWLYKNVKKMGGDIVVHKNGSLYVYEELLKKLSKHPWKIKAKPLSQLGNDWSCEEMDVHQVNQKIADFLNRQRRLNVFLTGKTRVAYSVTALGVDKAVAAERWAERYGLGLDQVAAIGDGFNDLALLNRVGLPMVVANAKPELLSKFSHHLPSNDEDGVAAGIDFILRSD